MNKLVKAVRELDAEARKKLEEVLQTPVTENQQMVLEPAEDAESLPPLPDWVHVYKGLSEEEIDELEKVILRRMTFRPPPE